MKNDRLYLKHIREALDKINNYTSKGRESFLQDQMAQDAVIRNFEIIGEASKQLKETTKKLEPNIPWRSVAGFRDVLIHNYMGVDIIEVWNVIENNIPALSKAIDRLFENSEI